MSDEPPIMAAESNPQLQLLGRLAEAGLEVALAIEARAKAAVQDHTIDLNGLSLAYDRVARAVRMTIALQARLIEDARTREDEAEAAAQDDLAERQEIHKIRAVRVVERVIEAERQDFDEVSRLVLKAERLLDDEDLYDDVLSRPIGELVARICRDLGLSPDWTRLAEEAWAKKEMAEGVEGSPFAEFERFPLPLDGGEVRSGGDGSATARPTGHPHPRPFPHRGGRESPHAASFRDSS